MTSVDPTKLLRARSLLLAERRLARPAARDLARHIREQGYAAGADRDVARSYLASARRQATLAPRIDASGQEVVGHAEYSILRSASIGARCYTTRRIVSGDARGAVRRPMLREYIDASTDGYKAPVVSGAPRTLETTAYADPIDRDQLTDAIARADRAASVARDFALWTRQDAEEGWRRQIQIVVHGAPRSYLPVGTSDSPDARLAAGAMRPLPLSAAGKLAVGDCSAVGGHGLSPAVQSTGGSAQYQAPGARRCYRVCRAKSAPTVEIKKPH